MPNLEDLLIDRAELDRGLLAEVLAPLVGIDRNTSEVVPMEGWNGLSAEGKVLVFLLARKAMAALPGVRMESEGAMPREIEEATGVKGGTLRPKLARMKARGLVSQDRAKRYFVPTHAVLRVKELIGGHHSDGEG
jgi:hypothetical protein